MQLPAAMSSASMSMLRTGSPAVTPIKCSSSMSFTARGAEVIFLNRPIGGTAEDDLLLQVQGVIAEYERAKILERGRRGRRHAAQSGSVSALTGAPFGYRYVSRTQGGGVARFEVVEEEAHIVQTHLCVGWSGSNEPARRSADACSQTGCRDPRRYNELVRLHDPRHVG